MPEQSFETPIMPTGSGVADLEVAREQDALAAEQIDPQELVSMDEASSGAQAETEAHPS